MHPPPLATLACIAGLLRPLPSTAQPAPTRPAPAPPGREVQAEYEIYAHGLNVAELDGVFDFGSLTYQMRVTYHTTGLAGFFFRGQQTSLAEGVWRDNDPEPTRFVGDGEWRGQPRMTLIDYDHGQPVIRRLEPPNEAERDAVPPAEQTNTIDTLSALALLMRHVQATGRCEARVLTFDGRRLADVSAHTVGEETLAPSSRLAFHGRALRCDFEGRQLGGFLRNTDHARLRQIQRGSAWLAEITPGGLRVPVEITFGTRWFGEATMYLAKASEVPPGFVAKATGAPVGHGS